jgi:hypothetical protein
MATGLKLKSVLGKSASALIVAGSTLGTSTYAQAGLCSTCASQTSCRNVPVAWGCVFYNGYCTQGSVYCS